MVITRAAVITLISSDAAPRIRRRRTSAHCASWWGTVLISRTSVLNKGEVLSGRLVEVHRLGAATTMEVIPHLVVEKVVDAVVAVLAAGAGDHTRGTNIIMDAVMTMRISLTPGHYRRILLQRMLELTIRNMVPSLFAVMV